MIRRGAQTQTTKQPVNVVLFGVDSLWADHMSCYGYHRLTTPHMDRLASQGVLFERCYSPHIPTTPAYASMLTGLDAFSTQVVALRHQGGLPSTLRTLPEILRESGYETTCVGFEGNPSSRGFDRYIQYPKSWGSWDERPSPKAGSLNDVTIPELERLAAGEKPFFLFLRHMDPHSPYLPPPPFDTIFYSGDPCDPRRASIRPALEFKPFATYFQSWMPPGITDADYVVAQYDGALAYMDACIQRLLTRVEELGLADNTLIVLNGDHGETLADHDCYFDHHGLYDCTLHVPLMLRLPGRLPEGVRLTGYTLHQDLVPTIMELIGLSDSGAAREVRFDGKSLVPMIEGRVSSHAPEFYITECTWMRKHGWRTPEWKLIVALEPDFHFKPPVELYNLITDPGERLNLAEQEPGIVGALRERMEAWIARREQETGTTNPMATNLQWHGTPRKGPFPSSQAAYDELFIGGPAAAKKLQEKEKPQVKPAAG